MLTHVQVIEELIFLLCRKRIRSGISRKCKTGCQQEAVFSVVIIHCGPGTFLHGKRLI